MRRMRRGLIIWTVFLSFICTPVCAAEPDPIYKHNQELAVQWVNWRPISWERNDDVQTLASQLLYEAGSRKDAPRCIYNWICANIAYDWEALNQETYSTLLPSEVLRERKAVCEGISNLIQALFLEAGIPCIKVWGVTITEEMEWSNSGLDFTRANHTWNEFYMDGRWISMDCTMDIINGRSTYFNPDEAFFSQTHMCLRRGEDSPENRPSVQLIPEIAQAVEDGLVSLDWLSNYHCAATMAEWYTLTGLGANLDVPITRLAAAVSLASLLPETASPLPYSDIGDCSEEAHRALAALYSTGIMTGCSGCFFPDEPLTRQAAIAVLARVHRYTGGILCT